MLRQPIFTAALLVSVLGVSPALAQAPADEPASDEEPADGAPADSAESEAAEPAAAAPVAEPQEEEEPDRSDLVPFLGGMGKAYAGGVGVDVGAIEQSLRPLFGSDVAIGDVGAMVGGGGFGLIGPIVLGGGGYALLMPASDSDDGTVSLVGGGGGFSLGWAVVRNRDWIVYPSFGLGGFGYTLSITNVGGTPVSIGDEVSIEPGAKVDLQGGFMTMDLGISANRMLFMGNDGGFAVGLDAGFLTSVSGGEWETEDGAVANALERARIRGLYMRLTLGGGGFFMDDI